MKSTLWIFDYDDTLVPTYIYGMAVNKENANDLFIYMNNIINTLHYIKNKIGGSHIIILTASLPPWVTQSLSMINRNLIEYKEHIDKDYIVKKRRLLKYNKIHVDILNNHNYISNYIINILDIKIYYVINIEKNYFGTNERHYKLNSLVTLMNLYKKYNNLIILGDSEDNELNASLLLMSSPLLKKHKINIKFVKYTPNLTIEQKLDESLVFYGGVKNIFNGIKNVYTLI